MSRYKEHHLDCPKMCAFARVMSSSRRYHPGVDSYYRKVMHPTVFESHNWVVEKALAVRYLFAVLRFQVSLNLFAINVH